MQYQEIHTYTNRIKQKKKAFQIEKVIFTRCAFSNTPTSSSENRCDKQWATLTPIKEKVCPKKKKAICE